MSRFMESIRPLWCHFLRCPPLSRVWDPPDGRCYVANPPTCGLPLTLSPALKRWGPPGSHYFTVGDKKLEVGHRRIVCITLVPLRDPKASKWGRRAQVAHKWAEWRHNPCRLGSPQRFKAWEIIGSGQQVGGPATFPLPSEESPSLQGGEHNHNQEDGPQVG